MGEGVIGVLLILLVVAVFIVIFTAAAIGAVLFLAFLVWLLSYNVGVGREILTYEWDSGEKILWLLILLFLYPVGGWLYANYRRQPRNAQLAALRKAHDPRVAHITKNPA